MHRTYALKLARELNAGKRAALEAVVEEWQRTLPRAFQWYWASFWKTGRFNPRLRCSGPTSRFPATRLVTSQKDMMLRALAGQAQAWAANLANRGRSLGNCITDPTLCHEVAWINACEAWLMPNQAQNEMLRPDKGPGHISQAATRIARAWFRNYVKRFKLPDPLGLPLQFNQLSARLESSLSAKNKFFGYWGKLSTLERGKRICVPLEPHAYFAAAGGEVAKTFSLRQKDGELYFDVVREVPRGTWERAGVPVLALDLGLRNFIASSEGDLRGEGFIQQLKRYDKQLQATTKGLQQAGVRRLAECSRYRRLVARIRKFIKNSVQRWVRSVLEAHAPQEVVVEKLAFIEADSGLGRRMNRLLRNFGQQVFKETMKSWSELKGFRVTEVDPAYTSQMCSSCGFVHGTNRKGNSFGCLSCGHRAHADVNAAKNLRGRSTQAAASVSGGRHEWWARALKAWLVRLRTGLLEASPGSALEQRLVWRARAGLHQTLENKRSRTAALEVVREFVSTLEPGIDAVLHKTMTSLTNASGQDDHLAISTK